METAPVGLVRGSVSEGTNVSTSLTVLISLGRESREGMDVAIQLDFFGAVRMMFIVHSKIENCKMGMYVDCCVHIIKMK